MLAALPLCAGESAWVEIAPAQWTGTIKAEVPALKRAIAAVIASPAKSAAPLVAASAQPQAPGLYEVRVTLRPSHVGSAGAAGAIAFNSGIRVKAGGDAAKVAAELPGRFFARAHQPETRTFQLVQQSASLLALRLEAFTDAAVVQTAQTAADLKKGGPKLGEVGGGADDDKGIGDLETVLTPERAVYYLVDKIEFRLLSRSGRVTAVETDKIRYNPGDTLKGSVVVSDVGGKGGEGVVNLFLEHNVKDRTQVKSLPVKLTPAAQKLSFEFPLPTVELGYALVAEYVSADGADRSEAAEYFNIAASYNRVAIFGSVGHTRDCTLTDDEIRKAVSAAHSEYINSCEYFAWAEDDMVAMSPDSDYWFSGQTSYHMNKPTIQNQIRIAHEQGVAIVSYGKFVMSSYPGWKTAYDYPNDHRGQYNYPIGMWEGVNVTILDRFRNKEYVPYSYRPGVTGNAFNAWWQEFLPINPDATPRMTRIAAEAMMRSVEMFGWDGIRWDGHPRVGGQCGSSGTYELAAARRTQALVHYFKDIVNAKYPHFGHGYNYLLIEPKKSYEWAVEDYELDEVARGGGLLMNESIGNSSSGWTFESIARNLQVEGDLSRERGGYYLGISYAKSPRDNVIEGALWAAGGARLYGSIFSREVRRYLTRYSQYTFDENLRRLVTPEKVLAPQAETKLWWQPFVYETPLVNGKRQLVVNLLNLPQQAKRPQMEHAKLEWDMPAGTDPVVFALTLPNGVRATAVNLINPVTLEIVSLSLAENRFEVPAVASWSVAVIDLAVDAAAPPLASLYGPPKTFGVPRPGMKEERKPEVVLDPKRETWEVNKDMSVLSPSTNAKQGEDQAALDALPWDERNARILKMRDLHSADAFIKDWWKGAALPDDLKLKDKKFDFGDLAPIHNGRFDIYHCRGAMDYRLRMAEVVAGLDRFNVYDAPLYGIVRQGSGMGLGNGVLWQRYKDFDMLLLTGIPHCAIGAENCYGLAEYIKSGGSAFFTGGEYAFGKGGYMYTVLERDVLPVLCVENVDTRYVETPLVIEPGKDFAELKIKADFAAKPSFWVWNQVALKNDPGIKVFLKSGNRPILVGWQVGKGRVACLLVDHRGKSEKDVTAYFDWADWPDLSRAVFAWLAPDAGKIEAPAPSVAAAEARKIAEGLSRESMAGDLEGVLGENSGSSLKGAALEKRVTAIRKLLGSNLAPVPSAILLEQLATVGGLPDDVRWAIVDCVRANPPANLTERVDAALKSKDNAIRQSVFQLLGAADPKALLRELNNPPALETDMVLRLQALVLGLPLVAKPDLIDEGRRRLKQWNEKEKEILDKWTGGKGFSLGAPETPGLDADALLQRVAWLAYLSRHDPKTVGAQFAREWLMTAQYQDYCDRTAANFWTRNMSALEVKRARAKGEEWGRMRACFGRMRELTRPDIDALLKSQPDIAAEGFHQAHFTLEYRTAMNLLGDQDRGVVAGILEKLKTAVNADLADFAKARLNTVKK